MNRLTALLLVAMAVSAMGATMRGKVTDTPAPQVDKPMTPPPPDPPKEHDSQDDTAVQAAAGGSSGEVVMSSAPATVLSGSEDAHGRAVASTPAVEEDKKKWKTTSSNHPGQAEMDEHPVNMQHWEKQYGDLLSLLDEMDQEDAEVFAKMKTMNKSMNAGAEHAVETPAQAEAEAQAAPQHPEKDVENAVGAGSETGERSAAPEQAAAAPEQKGEEVKNTVNMEHVASGPAVDAKDLIGRHGLVGPNGEIVHIPNPGPAPQEPANSYFVSKFNGPIAGAKRPDYKCELCMMVMGRKLAGSVDLCSGLVHVDDKTNCENIIAALTLYDRYLVDWLYTEGCERFNAKALKPHANTKPAPSEEQVEAAAEEKEEKKEEQEAVAHAFGKDQEGAAPEQTAPVALLQIVNGGDSDGPASNEVAGSRVEPPHALAKGDPQSEVDQAETLQDNNADLVAAAASESDHDEDHEAQAVSFQSTDLADGDDVATKWIRTVPCPPHAVCSWMMFNGKSFCEFEVTKYRRTAQFHQAHRLPLEKAEEDGDADAKKDEAAEEAEPSTQEAEADDEKAKEEVAKEETAEEAQKYTKSAPPEETSAQVEEVPKL